MTDTAVLLRCHGEGLGGGGLEAALAISEKTLSSETEFIYMNVSRRKRAAKVNHLAFTQPFEGSLFQLSASCSHGADGSWRGEGHRQLFERWNIQCARYIVASTLF